jgi:hypothetical protein
LRQGQNGNGRKVLSLQVRSHVTDKIQRPSA